MKMDVPQPLLASCVVESVCIGQLIHLVTENRTFPDGSSLRKIPFMSRLLSRLSPVVPLCFLAGCAMPDEREINAIQAIPRLEKELGGIYRDAAVQRYVADIGTRTARCAGCEGLGWQFKVLDSRQINAFALPGGKVYITRGLLAKLENEAQLVSILGHEIAHVARGHALQQLQRVQALQDGPIVAAMVAGSSKGGINPFIAGLRKYSRDQEREADLSGLNCVARQGYDPHAMLRTMEILKDACGIESPETLSTHPTSDNRRQYLEQEIELRYEGRMQGKTNAEQFQRIVLERR
jgi:predicted Zn-dependent protease